MPVWIFSIPCSIELERCLRSLEVTVYLPCVFRLIEKPHVHRLQTRVFEPPPCFLKLGAGGPCKIVHVRLPIMVHRGTVWVVDNFYLNGKPRYAP